MQESLPPNRHKRLHYKHLERCFSPVTSSDYHPVYYQFVDFPNEEIELRADDGRLVLHQKNPFENTSVLYAQSECSFFRKENGMEIEFSKEELALSCEIKFGKNTYRLQRVD